MPKNRPWSREELILALDLYFKIGASYKTHPEVIELSAELNRLADADSESDATRFRNPNGVAMKLGNFARLDHDYSGSGLTHGNKLEPIIWDEFSSNRQQLESAARQIAAPPQVAERSYYALNANPDTYRIEEAVAALTSDSWSVGRSWLEPGDRVIIWKSYGKLGRPAHRGIVGFGEVVDTPTNRAAPNKYWTDTTSGQVIAPRVTVDYVSLANLPLWEDDFPELADLTVSGSQGTVFRVATEQFNSAVSLAGGWPERNDIDDLAAVQKANKSRGQGFAVCQDCKRAIELRAMELATNYYKEAGYTVTDVSGHASYDLSCYKAGITLHTEVKGTTRDEEKILLTPNEVQHAKDYSPVALFIVKSIIVNHAPTGHCQAAGGKPVHLDPWDIGQGKLEPVGYSYQPISI